MTATADDLTDFDLSVLLANSDHDCRAYRAALQVQRHQWHIDALGKYNVQLLKENDGLRTEADWLRAEVEQLRGRVIGLCERIQAQAELLRRRAERAALATVWGDVAPAADSGAAESPDPGDTL
jgi:hypothetical protein